MSDMVIDEFEDEALPLVKKDHHHAPVLRVPPEINSILIKKGIKTPFNGVVLLEWNKGVKKLEIKLWNKDAPLEKGNPRYAHLCFLSGDKDSLKRTKLHYSKGVLIKVHHG